MITALRMQPNGRRVAVEVDGRTVLQVEKILAATLRVGQELGPEAVERLREEDKLEVAFGRCLSLIARRPRSRAELERYLRGRKIGAQSAEQILTRLADRGLVDDKAFAAAWVENRQALHPRSRRALRAELRVFGVNEADARQALDVVREEDAALAAARRRAARRSMGSGRSGQVRLEFERKIAAFLANRGFDFELSREIARRVWLESRPADGRGRSASNMESEDEL